MRSLLLALMLPGVAAAQFSGVQPGTRVRASLPPRSERMIGTLIVPINDSVRLQAQRGALVPVAGPVTFPTTHLVKLEVSRGPSRWNGAKRGALLGALVGAGVPLLAALSSNVSNEGGGPTLIAVVVPAAALGMVPGALVGPIFPAERWDRVMP